MRALRLSVTRRSEAVALLRALAALGSAEDRSLRGQNLRRRARLCARMLERLRPEVTDRRDLGTEAG